MINGESRLVNLPGMMEAAKIEFEYTMRQKFELSTGDKIKDPQPKRIKETSVFVIDDGEWKLLESRTNWDREKLELKEA